MGAVNLSIGDGTARFRRSNLCSSSLHIVMLVSVVITNLFALYAFKFAPAAMAGKRSSINQTGNPGDAALLSDRISLIVREIGSSEKKLSQIEKEILGYETLDLSKRKLAPELKLFLSRHPLPLGRDSRTGITVMVSSVGHSCGRRVDLLSQFMTYKPGELCPVAADLPSKLVSNGCDPLPRRRCRSRTSPKPDPLPLPLSLWDPISEKISGWKGFDKKMWVTARGKNDFLIDEVLALGTNIRIGFDINGGSGDFAARMAEKNVTVVTSLLNNSRTLGDFVAARGLFPLFLIPAERLPFQDSIFDIVHVMHGLGEAGGGGSRPEFMEFFLFDVDRVLRSGGLLWLDNWFLADEKKKVEFTSLVDKFGYKKLKWVVGEKSDLSGSGKKVCLSTVLQKPARG
ncbi:S-adenosyl-L-methionine-dependent methyltransferases superfamily protein [Wolffia australiana]